MHPTDLEKLSDKSPERPRVSTFGGAKGGETASLAPFRGLSMGHGEAIVELSDSFSRTLGE